MQAAHAILKNGTHPEREIIILGDGQRETWADDNTVLRWGLLSLAVGLFVAAILLRAPATLNSSAWYFGSAIFTLASIVALAAWAFHTSIAGQRLWKRNLFE